MGKVLFVVPETAGDIRHPHIFMDMTFYVIQNILEHLPLGFGRRSHVELLEVLVMDFTHNKSGHVINGQAVIIGTDGILKLLHQNDDFFRIQCPAILGNQEPDVIFRQIAERFRGTVFRNYRGEWMRGDKMHPVKAAVGRLEAAAQVKGRLSRREKESFTCINGIVLVLVGDV